MNLDKIDSALGQRVHEHLLSIGLETPMTDLVHNDYHQKIDKITGLIQEAMLTLGLDLTDDSLIDTPKRVAKMWVKEKFWALDPALFPKVTTIQNKMKYDQMLVENDIRVMSDCEHHLVTIDGLATIGYIPADNVIGLSKLNRIVDYFSHRPQVQERLTQQIGETLKLILNTDDVAVVVNAKHYCVISRGIQDQNSSTKTAFLSGSFRTDANVRREFFSLVK